MEGFHLPRLGRRTGAVIASLALAVGPLVADGGMPEAVGATGVGISAPAFKDCGSEYVVQPGDSRIGIANRCGVLATQVAQLNKLGPTSGLKPNQHLKLPPRDDVGAAERAGRVRQLQAAGQLPSDADLAVLPSGLPVAGNARPASQQWHDAQHNRPLGDQLFDTLSMPQTERWLGIYFNDVTASGFSGEALIDQLGATVEGESLRHVQVEGDIKDRTAAMGLAQVTRPYEFEPMLTSLTAQGEAFRLTVLNQGVEGFNAYNKGKGQPVFVQVLQQYAQLHDSTTVPAPANRPTPPPATTAAPPPPPPPSPNTGAWHQYKVQAGQTAYGLARACKVPYQDLATHNPQVPDLRKLRAGQTILNLPPGCKP